MAAAFVLSHGAAPASPTTAPVTALRGRRRYRNSQVVRLLRMIRTLAARHLTIQQIATEFQITTRTVWRDLAALQEAGVPLRDDRPVLGGAPCWHVINPRRDAATW